MYRYSDPSRLKAGDRLSASGFNGLLDRVEGQELAADFPLEVSRLAGGRLLRWVGERSYLIQILGSSGTTPIQYSWQEVILNLDGTTVVKPGGMAGDTTTGFALEVNNLSVAIGQVFLAWRGQGEYYWFSGSLTPATPILQDPCGNSFLSPPSTWPGYQLGVLQFLAHSSSNCLEWVTPSSCIPSGSGSGSGGGGGGGRSPTPCCPSLVLPATLHASYSGGGTVTLTDNSGTGSGPWIQGDGGATHGTTGYTLFCSGTSWIFQHAGHTFASASQSCTTFSVTTVPDGSGFTYTVTL